MRLHNTFKKWNNEIQDEHIFQCIGSPTTKDDLYSQPTRLTHLSQRDSQTSHTAPTITKGLPGSISIGLHPVQNLLYCHIMTLSNIQLDTVHFIRLGVNFIPTIESFIVEVLADFRFVVNGGEEGGVVLGSGCNR